MPAANTVSRPPRIQRKEPSVRRTRILYGFWIAVILAVFALHFAHLLADFPNNSPWMDYSKYTDEGWYGSAAVRYFLAGHWFLPGDFNPAVALPVWPLLLGVLFHFTGVSLAAARALALSVLGANLLLSYAIVRARAPRWAALLAVTVVVTNPFLYAFSRLAILEPLLICLMLLSWLAAQRLPKLTPPRQIPALAATGLLLCLAVLTKTTAVFLVPSTLWLIVDACGFRLRASLRALAITAVAALIPWCAWYFGFVRPHHFADYQYLFKANKWPQPATPAGWLAAFWYALHGCLWISPAVCILTLGLILLCLLSLRSAGGRGSAREFWRNPVLIASLLAIAGYIFFIGWHNNAQPRYYQPLAFPLAFIASLAASSLIRSRALALRAGGMASILVLAGLCGSGLVQNANYIGNPEYTWWNAAQGLTRYIQEHPAPNRLLLSISGANISLMTSLPSICDGYGSWHLRSRIHAYHPAWFATWNEIDPGTLSALETQYSLRRVAEFPAFDDPDRNLLILYRLYPLPASKQSYDAAQVTSENAGR